MKPKIFDRFKSLKIWEIFVVSTLIAVYSGYLYWKVFISQKEEEALKKEAVVL